MGISKTERRDPPKEEMIGALVIYSQSVDGVHSNRLNASFAPKINMGVSALPRSFLKDSKNVFAMICAI